MIKVLTLRRVPSREACYHDLKRDFKSRREVCFNKYITQVFKFSVHLREFFASNSISQELRASIADFQGKFIKILCIVQSS